MRSDRNPMMLTDDNELCRASIKKIGASLERRLCEPDKAGEWGFVGVRKWEWKPILMEYPQDQQFRATYIVESTWKRRLGQNGEDVKECQALYAWKDRLPTKLKGKAHETVVRPAMIFCLEIVALQSGRKWGLGWSHCLINHRGLGKDSLMGKIKEN